MINQLDLNGPVSCLRKIACISDKESCLQARKGYSHDVSNNLRSLSCVNMTRSGMLENIYGKEVCEKYRYNFNTSKV